MDFKYSEEQQMLTESLRRLGKYVWSFEQRRQRQAKAELDSQAWQQLAELGVLGLTIPEEFDGFGESPASLLAIHLELGRSLVAEPVISSSVHSSAILRASHSTQAQQLLPQLASGEAVCSVALRETGRVDDVADVKTQATKNVEGYVVTGSKQAVSWGAQANYLVVSANLDGQLALFLVPADAAGVQRTDYPTMDGMRCATVSLEQVAVSAEALLATGDQAVDILRNAEQEATVALCAQTVGMMEQLLAITIEYLKTRQDRKSVV